MCGLYVIILTWNNFVYTRPVAWVKQKEFKYGTRRQTAQTTDHCDFLRVSFSRDVGADNNVLQQKRGLHETDTCSAEADSREGKGH